VINMTTQIKYICDDCHDEEKCELIAHIKNIEQYNRLKIHPLFCIFNDIECNWIKVVE